MPTRPVSAAGCWHNSQTAGGGGRREEGFTDISTAGHYSTEQAACLLDQPRHPFILTGFTDVWARTAGFGLCGSGQFTRRGVCGVPGLFRAV
ncbi:hypothetical protein CesoFtcFv8_004675 [Champsocephalus esox]|uniref:Uncharacterized protein n=1 Tax=Champsocephalus esox TaxID=159716 RepID=A0AAN8CN37_9TELE|nr:hypothetical protein CesoFtcFv8_004675 [Champsocephalus esox]